MSADVKLDDVYRALEDIGPTTNRAIVNHLSDPEFGVHMVARSLEALVAHGCAVVLSRERGRIVYGATGLTPEEYRSQVRAGQVDEE